MQDLAAARERMVEMQVARRGVHDRRVLDAMRKVPRERFVDPGYEELAYEDGALPISDGQTISQPYIVALMLEAAMIEPGDRVLEVGAGSGYAAAVASRLARQVHAIERHRALAAAAAGRFASLDYDNIELRVADGTLGWASAAPFDAILVSAGGPEAPRALLDQLSPGGRLVIPVGTGAGSQRLMRFTRRPDGGFDTDVIGAVRFVPLIGEQGWSENGSPSAPRHDPPPSDPPSLPRMIARAAEPLPDVDDPLFAAEFDRFANRRVVLLGEATHGTSEFYRARAAITRRLVEHHGFTIIAVEADWPDAASIDRHVRQRPAGPRAEARRRSFERFPTWMWRNTDVAAFVEWLRMHNARTAAARRAGFFGLDLYNLTGSIAAVLEYLDGVDPEAAAVARERYGCLTPWQKDPATYGRAMLSERFRSCEAAVTAQCRALLDRQLEYAADGDDEFLDAAQNARLVASAERYYRAMYYGGAESWNLRDSHMFQTLAHLLDARGPHTRAVVWAHNSHIGDARFTEMGMLRNELNIGQLCRERFGDEAASIGFGTDSGTVAAASDWGGDLELKHVRPGIKDSIEGLCHEAGVPRFLLDLSPRRHPALRRRLLDPRPERFIGVIYRPDTERQSHYADVSLPGQFDAFVWLDQTTAITPLDDAPPRADVPDTWPFVL